MARCRRKHAFLCDNRVMLWETDIEERIHDLFMIGGGRD